MILRRTRTLAQWASIIFVFAAAPSTAGVFLSTPAVPWTATEKLSFNVTVGVLAAGQATLEVRDIADLEISTSGVTRKYKAYHFTAIANTNSFVDVFFKVRDRNESWLDVSELISHRFEQHNREGKYILDQIVDYDWINGHFKQTDNVKGRLPKIEEGELPIPVVDTLSSLYMARTKELKVGEDFTLDVHSGKIYPLLVKVHRKETVKVKAGKFECFLVEPFLKERGLFIQKGRKLQVWLTADERRMPVKMKAEIFIGHVTAELAEFIP